MRATDNHPTRKTGLTKNPDHSTSQIRVFIADDHVVVCDGLRLILELEPDMVVVGTAHDGQEAVREVCKLGPDVVIMDVAMPGMSGIEAARRIRDSGPSATKIVILSMCVTTEHIYQAMNAGALGYVAKESAGNEVVTAVRAVHGNRRYLSEKVSNMIADDFITRYRPQDKKSPVERLSTRELEILYMVVEGKSSKEIADVVSLSRKTVETYRGRLMQKLGVVGVPNLMKFAMEHGLVKPL
jgi:DNA-binding NarL/FixJ family response regulator